MKQTPMVITNGSQTDLVSEQFFVHRAHGAHGISLGDAVAPLKEGTVVAAGRDEALVEDRPSHASDVAGVASIVERPRALGHAWIPEELYLWPEMEVEEAKDKVQPREGN